MRKNYSNIQNEYDIKALSSWAREVTRLRSFDLDDYNNQVAGNPFIYNAPATSSTFVGTEKEGDLAFDASYLYIVVDNAGTLEWRRVSLSTF